MFEFHPGSFKSDVIYKQKNHVLQAIWNGEVSPKLSCNLKSWMFAKRMNLLTNTFSLFQLNNRCTKHFASLQYAMDINTWGLNQR